MIKIKSGLRPLQLPDAGFHEGRRHSMDSKVGEKLCQYIRFIYLASKCSGIRCLQQKLEHDFHRFSAGWQSCETMDCSHGRGPMLQSPQSAVFANFLRKNGDFLENQGSGNVF
jgi:hypothetical protein